MAAYLSDNPFVPKHNPFPMKRRQRAHYTQQPRPKSSDILQYKWVNKRLAVYLELYRITTSLCPCHTSHPT